MAAMAAMVDLGVGVEKVAMEAMVAVVATGNRDGRETKVELGAMVLMVVMEAMVEEVAMEAMVAVAIMVRTVVVEAMV